MIYVGDALFVGGNDYPAEQAGVISIPVRGPDETKRVIEAVIACLDDGEQVRPLRWMDERIQAAPLGDVDGAGARQSPGSGRVLNPAAVRGPDGELYLFPRLVAAGNYSRVGIAR